MAPVPPPLTSTTFPSASTFNKFGEDFSEVESLAKINYRTEGIEMKASVNDGKGTIRQGQGGEEDVQEMDF